ncbi:MAG: efflux RND transporter permease subunit [Treponema sp.]|nr:efflux RND transporter permease subunit [Treponema sp.]
MKHVLRFSVKHPVSVLMMALLIVIGGGICALSIKIDFLPTLSERNILVTVKYTGMPAAEMKKFVTVPVEDAFASLNGIKNITSVTRDGMSLVHLELHWGTDSDIALVESREIIDMCYERLPQGCEKPDAVIFNPVQRDTVLIAVQSCDGDLTYGRYIVDNEIKQRFQRLEGVGAVSVTGGDKEEIRVVADRTRLESKHLSLQIVADSIAAANFEYPAGTVKAGDKDLLLKTSGLYDSLDDISNTPLLYNDGGVVHVKDVAVVERGVQERDSFFLYNGTECICLGIQKRQGASPLAVSQRVREELKRLDDIYGKHCTFQIISDSSQYMRDSLLQLCLSACIGIAITVCVLYVFLKTLASALLVASIIPLCILFSLIALVAAGRTLNTLSLSGMTIGIGMVIDTGTVVLENIQQKIAAMKKNHFADCLVQAVEEVALSTVGSSVTTVIVFVPFFFLSGILGELFADMAVAVISSIAFSCILSLTYMPAAMLLIFQNNSALLAVSRAVPCLEQRYEKMLRTLFAKKWSALAILVCCTFAGIMPLHLLKKEFLPTAYAPVVSFELSFEEGTPLEKIREYAVYMQDAVARMPHVDAAFFSGGIDVQNTAAFSNPSKKKESLAVSLMTTKPDAVKDAVHAMLDETSFEYAFAHNDDLLSEVLALQSDAAVLFVSDDMQRKIETVAAHVDRIVPSSHVVEHVFLPDRVACARFNVTTMHTARLARQTLEGSDASYYYEHGRRIPISVCFPRHEISAVDELLRVNVLLENSYVPLGTLGTFHTQASEKIIYRHARKDAKLLMGAISDECKTSAEVVALADEQVSELFGNAGVLLAVIIMLLYCVMGAQFEDYFIPLLILTALLPAFSGAFIALMLCGCSININSVIALVVLFGTSVNNAIILYENCAHMTRINVERIIYACKKKLRAIILTNATTVFALVPFAIDPYNKNPQSAMAAAVIGGLVFSMLIVLLVVPQLMHMALRRRKL